MTPEERARLLRNSNQPLSVDAAANAAGGGMSTALPPNPGSPAPAPLRPPANFAGVQGGFATGPQRAPAGLNPVAAGSPQSLRLSAMGVPEAVQNQAPILDEARRGMVAAGGSTGSLRGYQNIGDYGGGANIYGKASTPGGRMDTFAGVGTPAPPVDPVQAELMNTLRGGASAGAGRREPQRMFGNPNNANRESSINRRFDELAKSLESKYSSPQAQGNLARRLMELEGMRQNALSGNEQNMTARRGQNTNANIEGTRNATTLRGQNLNTLATMAGQRADMTSASLRAVTDAQRLAADQESAVREIEDKGAGAIGDLAQTLFPENKERAAEFQRFVLTSNPEVAKLPAAERDATVAAMFDSFANGSEGAVRDRAARLGAPISQGANIPDAEPVPVTLSDAWNNKATVGDWWESFNVFGPNDPTALSLRDAQNNTTMKVSEKDYVTRREGSRNADIMSRLRRARGEE